MATWRRAGAPELEAERSLALLGRARWAFAGPGSPSYALRQWRGTDVPDSLVDVVTRGGTLVMGSAAACTVGASALPVYEIYKAGADLYWDDGLDLLGRLTGIHAAVLPHYDNAEGGTYDTRFCYLGERRLRQMEDLLDDRVGVLGVDEHTAFELDLRSRTAVVSGKGAVTLRRRGVDTSLRDGDSLSFEDVTAIMSGTAVAESRAALEREESGGGGTERGGGGGPTADDVPAATGTAAPPHAEHAGSLRGAAEAYRTAFETAVAASDVDGAVSAALALEQAVRDWSADTLQSDDADVARRVLRAMVVRLGELAVAGTADPRAAVAPFVESLLALRATAREDKDFATSDRVRDALVAAGVEVRDTADGVEWVLAEA